MRDAATAATVPAATPAPGSNGTAPTQAETETAEATFMRAYGAQAAPSVRRRLGIETDSIAGGMIMYARNDPSHFFNKALGFPGPVTADLVEQIINRFRTAEIDKATLQFAPALLPADWDYIADDHGLVRGASMVKFAGPLDAINPQGRTTLRIAPVAPEDATAWSAVVFGTLGLGETAEMLAGTVHQENFRPFAAWDGDTIVGGGNLFIHGDIAATSAGGTLESHRNRGVQSALIAARAEAGRAAGCRWLTGEAFQPLPGGHNPSMSNMLRAGLTRLYERPDWVWHNPESR